MKDIDILNLIKEKRYNASCDEQYTLNNDKKNLSKLSNLRVAIATYDDLIIEIENRMNKEKNKNNELYKELIEKYGKKQVVVCVEELSELQKELCKYLRKDYTSDELKENIIEEIADVYIMLEQMKLYFNINEDKITNEILNKNIRTESRFKNYKL